MIHVSQALHEAIDHMKTLEGNKMTQHIEIVVQVDDETRIELNREVKNAAEMDPATPTTFSKAFALSDNLVPELRRCADAIAKAVEVL